MLNPSIKNKCILLTGASHGIGREVAVQLASQGARVTIVGRSSDVLDELAYDIGRAGGKAYPLAADLTDATTRANLVADAVEWMGGLDMLVNVAGNSPFGPFEAETAEDLDTLVALNVLAPMQLSRAAVAHFKTQGSGHLVNVGSIFGSIGFPHFAAYSATKFAMRGLSQALRRELAGTGIDVTYVAPRATKTRQTGAYADMVEATKMHLDEPRDVAAQIVRAIAKRSKDVYLGGPESVFVRLNAWLPRLVDRLMAKDTVKARPYAEASATRREAARKTRQERPQDPRRHTSHDTPAYESVDESSDTTQTITSRNGESVPCRS
jgi:short-subunit dehydrogenase